MASEIVVIGVVPRDRLSIFPRCLEALYAHTDGPFRVVLVAGGADHAIRQHLQTLQAQYANLSVVLMDKLLEQATTRNLVLQHLNHRERHSGPSPLAPSAEEGRGPRRRSTAPGFLGGGDPHSRGYGS